MSFMAQDLFRGGGSQTSGSVPDLTAALYKLLLSDDVHYPRDSRIDQQSEADQFGYPASGSHASEVYQRLYDYESPALKRVVQKGQSALIIAGSPWSARIIVGKPDAKQECFSKVLITHGTHRCYQCVFQWPEEMPGQRCIMVPKNYLGPDPIPQDAPCQTFEKYSQLPGELRAKIIAAAMNRPRLMCSHVTRARLEHPRSMSAYRHTLGPLYDVSREVRAEVLKVVKLSLPSVYGYRTYPWSYINPFYDTVFCREQGWAGNYEWDQIPWPSEAPGLCTLALALHPISLWVEDNNRPVFDKGAAERLASQLQHLPELREVLLVRELPEFMKYFLSQTYRGEETYQGQKPKPTMHDSGFFWNVHEHIELLIEKASKYQSSMEVGGIQGRVEDELDTWIKGLLQNRRDLFIKRAKTPETLASHYLGGQPFFKIQRSSVCIQEQFNKLMKEAYEKKYQNTKVPKFTMVYMPLKMGREFCYHNIC